MCGNETHYGKDCLYVSSWKASLNAENKSETSTAAMELERLNNEMKSTKLPTLDLEDFLENFLSEKLL